MVDLETWSAQPDALVISIGAAKYDPNGTGVIDSFEVHIDPEDAQRYGFHIDARTVMWWMSYDRNDARKIFMEAPKVDVGTALEGFWQWFKEGDDVEGVWGNGAPFDNVILRTMHEKAGVECPWPFWMDRCYRTVKSATSAPDMSTRHGTHHSALDDAISQALHHQEIVKALGYVV